MSQSPSMLLKEMINFNPPLVFVSQMVHDTFDVNARAWFTNFSGLLWMWPYRFSGEASLGFQHNILQEFYPSAFYLSCSLGLSLSLV